jgi:hypothetical protein
MLSRMLQALDPTAIFMVLGDSIASRVNEIEPKSFSEETNVHRTPGIESKSSEHGKVLEVRKTSNKFHKNIVTVQKISRR